MPLPSCLLHAVPKPSLSRRVLEEIVPSLDLLKEDLAGNFVVKAIAQLPPPLNDGLWAHVRKDFVRWATGGLSCRSVQTLLEKCSTDQVKPLIELVSKHCATIARDKFGAFVLEKALLIASQCLEAIAGGRDWTLHGTNMTPGTASLCINSVAERLPPITAEFVVSKAGSHGLEMVLRWADPASSIVTQEALLGHLPTASIARCGNFVVQQLLENGAPVIRARAIRTLQSMREALSASEYGQYVLKKLPPPEPASPDLAVAAP